MARKPPLCRACAYGDHATCGIALDGGLCCCAICRNRSLRNDGETPDSRHPRQ